jgi:hypothetical protein
MAKLVSTNSGFPRGFNRDYDLRKALSSTLVALPHKMPVEIAQKAAT